MGNYKLRRSTHYGFGAVGGSQLSTLSAQAYGVPRGKYFYLTKRGDGYGVSKTCTCCGDTKYYPLRVKYRVVGVDVVSFSFKVFRLTPVITEDLW